MFWVVPVKAQFSGFDTAVLLYSSCTNLASPFPVCHKHSLPAFEPYSIDEAMESNGSSIGTCPVDWQVFRTVKHIFKIGKLSNISVK